MKECDNSDCEFKHLDHVHVYSETDIGNLLCVNKKKGDFWYWSEDYIAEGKICGPIVSWGPAWEIELTRS